MKRILVVDDDFGVVSLLKEFLEVNGYFVDSSADAIEATRKLKDNEYDLIILDIMMSWMSGYDFCNVLKSTDNTSRIPVIMLTAKSNPRDREKGYESGADDYVTKPFDLDELHSRIKKILEG